MPDTNFTSAPQAEYPIFQITTAADLLGVPRGWFANKISAGKFSLVSPPHRTGATKRGYAITFRDCVHLKLVHALVGMRMPAADADRLAKRFSVQSDDGRAPGMLFPDSARTLFIARHVEGALVATVVRAEDFVSSGLSLDDLGEALIINMTKLMQDTVRGLIPAARAFVQALADEVLCEEDASAVLADTKVSA